MAVQHVDIANVLMLHALIMERTGFAPAPLLRDDALESAVMRPRMVERYEDDADVVRLATVLAVGISQAQAFLEGNKRTALAAARVFLETNGFTFIGDPLAMSEQLVQVAERVGERDAAEREFAAWLRENVAPLTESV